MMDHGYFDGPWRGGHCRTGTPYIFSAEWKAYLATRKAKAIEAQRAETNEDSVPSPDESAVPEGDLP